jgi:two-component system, cell cycle response regulator DivK
MKVLLVEDNAMNSDLLARRLRKRGIEVVVAVDGKQGIEMAESLLPNVILMDMSLPVIDGWEATRRLRAAPRTKGIPVIALTAHAMLGDREKAIEAGCDDYHTKPGDFEELVAKIQSLSSAAEGARE